MVDTLFNKLKVNKKIDLTKKLKNVKDLTVSVGFPQESQETNSKDSEGVSALFKATVNNFGLGIPKRPFMKLSFAKNKKEYRKLIIANFKKLDKLEYVKFLNKLGLKAQGDIKKTITSLKTPANDEQTIKQKGSSNPLINTGHMRQSVTYVVGKS
jgi:hypothetical protein